MKNFLIFLTAFLIFGSTACSSNGHNTHHGEVELTQDSEAAQSLSAEDQSIIKKYKDTIHNLNFREREHANQVMKDSLPEISKIKNDHEREKLQMQIYLATAMYKEAYDLNEEILKESFSIARLVAKCELSYYAQIPKNEVKACYTELAVIVQKELETTSKNDPKYIYGEWSYLLFMYKSGHDEYKQKMSLFLNNTLIQILKTDINISHTHKKLEEII